jgi:enoyl-CoA hydratase
MSAELLRYELRDGVAVIAMDDGKANALSHEMIGALNTSLDRAEREALAVLLTGRDGKFSAGFDLQTMRSGAESVKGLVLAGAELSLRLFLHPRPVITACSGHALAAGAILLLASDVRIGAAGDFKIGLNEVAIGLTLPRFAVELARARLSKRHFSAAATRARIYSPEMAVDAGFLDATTAAPALLATALAEARQLSALPDPAFRDTKRREREAVVGLIRETLDSDITEISGWKG